MKRFAVALCILLVALGTLVTPATATEARKTGGDSSQSEITRHAETIRERYNVAIDPADYEKVTQRVNGVRIETIKRKDSPDPRTPKVTRKATGEVTVDVSQERQIPNGSTVQPRQGFVWYAPDCPGWQIWDEEYGIFVGYMDRCFQWGETRYDQSTRDHSTVMSTSTCASDGGALDPPTWPIFLKCELYTEESDDPAAPALEWDDWAPKADDAVSGCGPYEATINAGPMSITIPLQVCDELDITKGAIAPNFASAWLGEAQGEERMSALLVSFNAPLDSDAKVVEGARVDYKL